MKAEIVRRGLVEHVSVSELCDEYGIPRSVYYAWRNQALAGLESIFEKSGGTRRPSSERDQERARLQLQRQIETLQTQSRRLENVIASLTRTQDQGTPAQAPAAETMTTDSAADSGINNVLGLFDPGDGTRAIEG